MDILGLVENMSGLQCPHCGKDIELFMAHGGQWVAKKENLRLLASLPIELEVVKNGDIGSLAPLDNEDLPFTREFNGMVDEIVKLGSTETPRAIRRVEPKEEDVMDKTIFAVPVAGGKLCAHFGHCEQFALIETQNGEIKTKTMHTPPPHEPGVLPRWLHEQGANVIIAGGMGARAQGLFSENGIKVITGASTDTPEAIVNQYLSDSLVTGANICDH
jgi:predicted Fe-Mo cluster-binding NifX family protein